LRITSSYHVECSIMSDHEPGPDAIRDEMERIYTEILRQTSPGTWNPHQGRLLSWSKAGKSERARPSTWAAVLATTLSTLPARDSPRQALRQRQGLAADREGAFGLPPVQGNCRTVIAKPQVGTHRRLLKV
jgi:hypothetical protein